MGNNHHQVNSALHPSEAAKSSTSFSSGKGGKGTVAGWQVTLCDPLWHVISRSGEVISTNCYIRFGWWRGTVARTSVMGGKHSLSQARPSADG